MSTNISMENLNLQEIAAVKELKSKVEDLLTPDVKDDENMFIRFLRARDFQMNLAEEMLRKHLTWRKVNQIEEIFTYFVPNEVTVKYLPLSRIGFDKDGYPIRYFDFGNMDCKGILKAARKNDVIKTIISYFESDIRVMQEQSLKLEKPIHKWVYIFNFEGYSFVKATHKPALEALITLFQTYEANYPERLKAAFIINSSIYFTMMFSVIKPLLSGATVRKIQIYGKEGWQNVLLDYIDAEVLPAFLGGKRTDPDGDSLCHTICMHGKMVPEEIHLTKNENRVSAQPGAKKLVVSRKSKTYLPLTVTKPGSMIEWEFETESGDIGFGLCFKECEKSTTNKELIPKQRIDVHIYSEAGMYKCKQPGTYILVFDNSYSWFHSKEIYCKASVILPEHQIN